MHPLRTVPLRLVSSVASQHDKKINTTFENIIGRKLTARQQQQLTMAIKHGGFGLAAATVTASSAFVQVWANTLSNLPDREYLRIKYAVSTQYRQVYYTVFIQYRQVYYTVYSSRPLGRPHVSSIKVISQKWWSLFRERFY